MESIFSVGIDIGTTTTQLAFSRLTIENTAGYFSAPRVEIVDKEIVYTSVPHFTPLNGQYEIDAAAVERLLFDEYKRADKRPEDISAGAVIITGEAAKKSNAAALIKALSHLAGDFVVQTAGPDLESVLAGKGSGAEAYSRANHCRVVNLDIGGGTTNAVLFDSGRVASVGCIDIGGRHVRVDDDRRITYISDAAGKILKSLGIVLSLGDAADERLTQLAGAMAELMYQMVDSGARTPLYSSVVTPNSANFEAGGVDALCFSGGVADVIYSASKATGEYPYGDIGVLLGKAVSASRLAQRYKLIRPGETIRATVIGACTHSTTISGSTISAAEHVLPLINIPVLFLEKEDYRRALLGDSEYVDNKLKWFLAQSGDEIAAISFDGERNPSYADIKMLSKSLIGAADRAFKPDAPLIVVVKEDMAKALGQVMRSSTRRPVVSIDGIAAGAHDAIDIGKPIMDGLAVPVVVKTLVFG